MAELMRHSLKSRDGNPGIVASNVRHEANSKQIHGTRRESHVGKMIGYI